VLHVDIDNVHYMVVHFGGYNTVFSHPYSQNPKKNNFGVHVMVSIHIRITSLGPHTNVSAYGVWQVFHINLWDPLQSRKVIEIER